MSQPPSKPKSATPESSGRLFKILSHPLRHRILTSLHEMEEGSPTQLADRLDEPVGNVSYHVKVLAEADAIELTRTEPRRGALEHFYRPITRAEIDDEHWSQLPASVRSRLFDDTIQDIWDCVVAARGKDGFDGERAHASLTRLRLDEEGHSAVADVLNEALQRLLAIETEVKSRVVNADGALTSTEVAILRFERD
jgi:DNA-binding transcriptional ArsR family regulator